MNTILENDIIRVREVEPHTYEGSYRYWKNQGLFHEILDEWSEWVGLSVFRSRESVREFMQTVREEEKPWFQCICSLTNKDYILIDLRKGEQKE